MSGYGLFMPSTLGMQSQSHRLNTIGYNIANVNTGGFKRTDTEFETVLSDRIFEQSDIGGVKPYARATNDIQGLITPTNNRMDLAIVGRGFYSLQTSIDSTDDIYFTRDGAFGINTVDGQTSSVTADDGSTITVSNGYLVDKNGFFVRGIPVAEDGTFSASGTAAPMRVDQYAFVGDSQETTLADLEFNLPSESEFGDDALSFALRAYDSAGTARDVTFSFDKMIDNNEWRVSISADNLTTGTLSPQTTYSLAVDFTNNTETLSFNGVGNTIQVLNAAGNGINGAFSDLMPGDQITFSGTTSNNSTFTIDNIINGGSTIVVSSGVTTETTAADASATATITSPMLFNSDGTLQSPTEMTLNATWSDAETSSFTIDFGNMTQLDGDFTTYRTSQNGYPSADLMNLSFDNAGRVIGTFSDGTERSIYQIPLYDFTNPNGLYTSNGMLFQESEASGGATAFLANESSKAELLPSALEISNVDIAQEFSRMIQTQNAYNMSATTFKTVDEMTITARDLKA